MNVQDDSVHIQALGLLYARILSGDFTRDRLDIFEAALDMIINSDREAETVDFLVRNVVRNARSSTYRTRRAERANAAKFPMADAKSRRVSEWRDGSEQHDIVDRSTPESWSIVTETIAELSTAAEALGKHGSACLEGMLAGATVAETAISAGVSRATVERCWKRLRDIARTLLNLPEQRANTSEKKK